MYFTSACCPTDFGCVDIHSFWARPGYYIISYLTIDSISTWLAIPSTVQFSVDSVAQNKQLKCRRHTHTHVCVINCGQWSGMRYWSFVMNIRCAWERRFTCTEEALCDSVWTASLLPIFPVTSAKPYETMRCIHTHHSQIEKLTEFHLLTEWSGIGTKKFRRRRTRLSWRSPFVHLKQYFYHTRSHLVLREYKYVRIRRTISRRKRGDSILRDRIEFREFSPLQFILDSTGKVNGFVCIQSSQAYMSFHNAFSMVFVCTTFCCENRPDAVQNKSKLRIRRKKGRKKTNAFRQWPEHTLANDKMYANGHQWVSLIDPSSRSRHTHTHCVRASVHGVAECFFFFLSQSRCSSAQPPLSPHVFGMFRLAIFIHWPVFCFLFFFLILFGRCHAVHAWPFGKSRIGIEMRFRVMTLDGWSSKKNKKCDATARGRTRTT